MRVAVTFGCGCVREMELEGSPDVVERKVRWFAHQCCSRCTDGDWMAFQAKLRAKECGSPGQPKATPT